MRNSWEKRFEGSLFSVFALSHFFSVFVFSAYFLSEKGLGSKIVGCAYSHWLEQRCPTLSTFATCGHFNRQAKNSTYWLEQSTNAFYKAVND